MAQLFQNSFQLNDQHEFAELSGDLNPMHVDPLYARRLIYGAAVVHGVHALLWAIDSWLLLLKRKTRIKFIETFFKAPILLDQTIFLKIDTPFSNPIILSLICDERIVLSSNISWSEDSAPPKLPDPLAPLINNQCRNLSIDEIESASGSIPLFCDKEIASQRFPHIGAFLPLHQYALIATLSRLVGTVCPGLNSIFSEFTLQFSESPSPSGELHYLVNRLDQRFSLIEMDIRNGLHHGHIKAFRRPSPHAQIRFAECVDKVPPEAFADQSAIIIGGSRGLGEVTAKLLTAGGAHIAFSYCNGKADADHLINEIHSKGGHAVAFHFDVLLKAKADLRQLRGNAGDHYLYYYATPPIFVGHKGRFSVNLFEHFCQFYVAGLINTLRAFADAGITISKIFYPSTSAIDELPSNMVEYAAAKSAGETLCQGLKKKRRLKILAPRLPRLATDQTASLFPVQNISPEIELIDHLFTLKGL